MAILVNGNGNARVYAAQDADLIASITGNTTVRTSVGNKMAATAADASTISVADGVIITKEGRRIQLDAGQTDLFTIPTGSVGVTNYYIIGYKLSQDADNVQVAETFVQLMASSTDTIPEGTFRGGDTDVYVSVARVEQDGVNLGTITALLPELETISEINSALTELITPHYVEVVADGTKTIKQLLDTLATLIDMTKISSSSTLESYGDATSCSVYQCIYSSTDPSQYGASFNQTYPSSGLSKLLSESIAVYSGNHSTYYIWDGSTVTNKGSTIASSGVKYRIVY